MQVKSPMLVSVGMYLPLETTFAIFVGGLVKGIVDMFRNKQQFTDIQSEKLENTGVLLASGLIAGEALMGLVFAIFAVFDKFPPAIFPNASFFFSLVVLSLIAFILIRFPLQAAKNNK